MFDGGPQLMISLTGKIISTWPTNLVQLSEERKQSVEPAGGAYVAPAVKFPRKSGHTDKLDLQGSTDKEGVSWPRRSGQRAIP